ncbi:hypothetical protein D3C73_1640720 [compost metagenome]
MLHEAKCGLWSQSGDLEGFKDNVITLNSDEKLRLEMGSNGRTFLEENFTVDKTYEIIVAH